VVRIVLGVTLRREEIVIATASAWKLAADRWTCGVDGAAALFCVEEAADAAKELVLLPAHRIFRADFDLRELLAGLFEGQIEMLGEAFDITLGQLDEGIGTAIAGTLRTIVHDATLEGWVILIRIRGRSTMERGTSNLGPAKSFAEQ